MRIPPLKINIPLEFNPLKSRFQFHGLAVHQRLPAASIVTLIIITIIIMIIITKHVYIYICFLRPTRCAAGNAHAPGPGRGRHITGILKHII